MPAAKTSQSHPLRIDPVAIRDGGGVIGLTLCPGKKQRSAYSGDWDRDLETDLQVIKAFGAKALVTLMENDELANVQVPAARLGSIATGLGLEWHHLPIKDVGTPDSGFEDLWTYSALRLRTLLACGESIVIHCLGGLGRTGTVGARLLVEFGDAPEEAIKKVRKARPGSIETRQQEDYVKRCKRVPPARGSRSRGERALACLLGGAIGDGFGYAVEFDSIGSIRARFGPQGITEPVFHDKKLVVSDDTQMTLFTLDGLLGFLHNGTGCADSCVESIRLAYMDWLETQSEDTISDRGRAGGWLAMVPAMCVRRAPGNTCLGALRTGGRGTLQKPINNSKGCGGVMRVAPIGLVQDPFDAAAAFQVAAKAAALTHGHPSGYLSAGLMAAMVRFLAEGAEIASAAEHSCELLRAYQGGEETLHSVQKAISLTRGDLGSHVAAVEKLGGGWVGEEALAIALYAVLSARTFTEAIRIAANHSGDSDSTASIAGQLWGAMHGLEGIPHTWITAVDVLKPLLQLARQLMPYV